MPTFASVDDHQDSRQILTVGIETTSITLDVMVSGPLSDALKPLVILNSLEFPIPPSEHFCEYFRQSGFQVIFIRRPGFGGSQPLPGPLLEPNNIRNGAAAACEAAVIIALLKTMGLKQIVLMGLGSANPVCYRLSLLCQDIVFSVFANPTFNQEIFDVFRPHWLQAMLRQVVVSKSGVKIATRGFKSALNTNPIWFYRQFVQKSEGDKKYVADNASDFVTSGRVLQTLDSQTLLYDLHMSLSNDPVLSNQFFQGMNAVVLSGEETTASWKARLDEEAVRLSLPVFYAPKGDMFVPYASQESLLDIILRYL